MAKSSSLSHWERGGVRGSNVRELQKSLLLHPELRSDLSQWER